jgi:nucleoside-diphosphate-sugar epimerase
MSEKLLIVGGTGFIGKNLTQKAVESGFLTTVLSSNLPKNDYQISKAEYLQANVSNSDQIKKILINRKFDYVVNLSGYIDHSGFLTGGRGVINTHFDGVQNLLQVIDWTHLKKFVQIGSSDEYGNQKAPQSEDIRESPISSYSAGKLFSTHLLQMLHKTEGLPVVILRLFLVYGPGQNNNRFLPQIIDGCSSDSSFPVSEGGQLRDFCYVDDISRGILMALKNKNVEGEVINLASGQSISIREVIEIVRRIVGKGRPDFGKIPYRSGENMNLYADTSKANKVLQWMPEISIVEGIKKTIISQTFKKE